MGAYVEKLRAWYDPEETGMVPVRDMGYLASEARMSIPVSDEGAGGVLTVHLNVFEFVPAEEVDDRPDEPESWSFLGAADLEIGREHYVFVTTSGGLYRYDMNDVVEMVDTYNATPVIVFRRKGRGMTNLTGEKLSVRTGRTAWHFGGRHFGGRANRLAPQRCTSALSAPRRPVDSGRANRPGGRTASHLGKRVLATGLVPAFAGGNRRGGNNRAPAAYGLQRARPARTRTRR